MNSLVVLFLVVVIHLNEGDGFHKTTPVQQCPSVEEVEAEVSTIPGVKHWGMRCGPIFLAPLTGEGA